MRGGNYKILQFALLFVCKSTDNIARFLNIIWRRAILILTINKSRFPAIVLRSDGEVNPIAPASIPFYQQFVIVLSGLIRIIHHDPVCFHSTLSQNHKITKSQITKGKMKWKIQMEVMK
jgi:hypothetical protein